MKTRNSSPNVSFQHEDSPRTTLSRQSSEFSLPRANSLDKWRLLIKKICRFFRWIRIPILRTRFIESIRHLTSIDESKKIHDDFLFIDEVQRFHEIFNSFAFVGFVWHDKEFRLAKLKAIYIYERFLNSIDGSIRINVSNETISSIPIRLNSTRTNDSSLTYFNVFNDAEKTIKESWLKNFFRFGSNVFLHRIKIQTKAIETFSIVEKTKIVVPHRKIVNREKIVRKSLKNVFEKAKPMRRVRSTPLIFICKVHTSTDSTFYSLSREKEENPYRMSLKHLRSQLCYPTQLIRRF